MAIIYFTNNADSGSGSLRAAVTNAKDGDVILPDETVFGRGASVEISLASRLDVRKTLTIDGGACRIRLNGGSSVVCLYVREGDATFVNVDVVAGRSASTSSFYPGGVRVDASATFKRCRIAGCESQTTGGAIFIASGGVANLVDCLVAGNRSAAGYGGLAVGGVANVAGSTLVGNLAATGANDVGGAGTVDLTNAIVGINAAEKTTSSGSVVGVAASQIGFVAPPPDSLASGVWTSELWKSWDLRLLDDASSAPSPYRDAGNVDAMSQYDVDGNFRGRDNGGVAACSPGAYETLQADLFWVGVDASGAPVASPSALSGPGWSTSRFHVASDDVAPRLGQNLFIDGAASFGEVLSTATTTQTFGLTIGGGSNVSVNNTSMLYLGKLQLGACASFQFKTSIQIRQTGIFGDWSSTNGTFTNFQAEYVGTNAYISSAYSYAFAPPEPYYGSLYIVLTLTKRERLSGDYRCKYFYVRPENAVVSSAGVAPGTTIRAQSYTFGRANHNLLLEHFFDGVPTLTPQGAAKISFITTELQGDWSGEFNVDVSEADSATASLCGQTVYGASPSVAVALSGVARIDERGLTARSLTLDSGATLNIDGGRVSAETLTLAAGTTIGFWGIDPVLSATETVSVADGAVLNGLGYVSAPSVDAFASATVGDDVRVCRNGADVQTFTVKSNGKNVVCRWEALDLSTPVLIESRVDERWIVEDGAALDGETEFISHASGDATFRVFDGEKFLQKSVFIAPFHAWLTYDNLFTSAIVVKSYTVVTEHILMSVYFNAGEAPVLLARVADSLTNVAVTTDDVESISLTVYKMQLYRGVKRRTALEGWVDVDVPITAVMEELIADDPRWKKDSVGYNFRYEPDLREKPLFNESGEYVVIVTIKFKEGNPAPLVFNVSVK